MPKQLHKINNFSPQESRPKNKLSPVECTYIDLVSDISLHDVVEDSSFMKVTQSSHVLQCVHTRLMHGHHKVRVQTTTRVSHIGL